MEEMVHAGPLGAARRGFLKIRGGTTQVKLASLGEEGLLFRAAFEEYRPKVEQTGDTLRLRYRFGPPVDGRTELALQAAIPWEIGVLGGMDELQVDARALQLSKFSLVGGLSRLDLRLGHPDGTVPIQIFGGVEDLRITCSKGAAISIRLWGGASSIRTDEVRSQSVGGYFRYDGDGAEGGTGRYELLVVGGAEDVEIVREAP